MFSNSEGARGKDPLDGFAEIGERTRLAKRNLLASAVVVILAGLVPGVDVSELTFLGVHTKPESLRWITGIAFIYFAIQWSLQFTRDFAEFGDFFSDNFGPWEKFARFLFWKKYEQCLGTIKFKAFLDPRDEWMGHEVLDDQSNTRLFDPDTGEEMPEGVGTPVIHRCLRRNNGKPLMCECMVLDINLFENRYLPCSKIGRSRTYDRREDAFRNQSKPLKPSFIPIVRQQSIRFVVFECIIPILLIAGASLALIYGNWEISHTVLHTR